MRSRILSATHHPGPCVFCWVFRSVLTHHMYTVGPAFSWGLLASGVFYRLSGRVLCWVFRSVLTKYTYTVRLAFSWASGPCSRVFYRLSQYLGVCSAGFCRLTKGVLWWIL